MGRGFGSKERLYHEASPRYGEKERRTGWGVAPHSRNLWVGNLSSRITESILSEEFLRFGEIESIAHVPGRSYAFINFAKEEDAVFALRALHGSNIAGMPIRIEFAKGDEAYMHHKDDRRSMEREELPPPSFRRDFRTQNISPEKPSDKSKGHRSTEPSEVLWIGFPSSLNVDEIMLRRAFSPFGEIDKITSFPGRSYAFVRFRSVVAAFRAKEALHGRFLNNPRVNICFAKSDVPTEGKFSEKASFSHLRGSSEKAYESFHGDEGFESPVRDFHRASPPFGFSFDRTPRAPCDQHALDSVRSKSSLLSDDQEPAFYGPYGNARLREFTSEKRASEDVYEGRRHFERSQRLPPFIDSWGLEDDRPFHLAKKHKSSILPDKDLPEYPFSDFEQEKRHGGLQKHTFNKPFDSIPFTLKHAHDVSRSLNCAQTEVDDYWGNVKPLSNCSPELHRSSSDSHKPPPRDEIWKWEGTIAKGGTPVFRARCFPVGKVLDFILPEFLNCTARTGLDMLAKHYYQAVGSWVVFFVPESDADISLYNDFMHYLGEKQRAAVAKLGEKVTLFLVPPSDFSEQVLKVPGKVSISGVILKFQQTASLQHSMDLRDSKAASLTQRPIEGLQIHEARSFLKPGSPDFKPFTQKWDDSFSYSSRPHEEKLSDFHMEKGHDHNPPMPSNWPNHMIPSPNPSPKVFSQPFSKELLNSSGYSSEIIASTSAAKPPPSITSKSLQPEQLAHLAVLLGNQKQAEENLSSRSDDRVKYLNSVQNPMIYNSSISQNNEQEPSNTVKEEAEVDPEKRLQATLQLAAALLQQIQQRSKAAD